MLWEFSRKRVEKENYAFAWTFCSEGAEIICTRDEKEEIWLNKGMEKIDKITSIDRCVRSTPAGSAGLQGG